MANTLLSIVQEIMSSMSSDEVNSISDTVESLQVATIVKSCYEEICERADLPEHFGLINLSASGDTSKPTLMTIPSNVDRVVWIKYNKETTDDTDMNYQNVSFLDLEDFLSFMYQLEESDTDVGNFTYTVGTNDVNFMYKSNKAPAYYTTFDDNTVIFDSYDSSVDTTLQSDKTLCKAKLIQTFNMSDTFEPNLDEGQMVLLKNMAKSLAWVELKQQQHPSAERSSSRAWVRAQSKKDKLDGLSYFDKLPNFGRK